MRGAQILCPHPPGECVGVPGPHDTCLDGVAKHGLDSEWVSMCPPPHGELYDSLLLTGHRASLARDQNQCPTLKGALHLLCIGDTENVFSVDEGKVSRIAATVATFWLALANMGVLRPLAVYGGDIPGPSLGFGQVDCYDPQCLECGLAVV
jgi:hypothetical protein